jgi:nicotinic acid mononucleotide adenylyltransferase
VKLSKPIRVIYVAGLDLFNRCSGMSSLRRSPMGGVAVVYRGGEDKSLVQSFINQNLPNVCFIDIEDDLNHISSTLIRQRMKSNENCSHLTYQSVLEYLQFIKIDN